MLTVSRDDIEHEHLQEFENPFIKLSLDKYMNLLDMEPISSQKAIVNALNNPKYRFVSAAISRRQGKTFIANIIGQLIALVPNSSVLIMSPQYSLSQISFELQRTLLRKFEIELLKDNAKDRVVQLTNRSEIRMGSVNQVDSCIGRSYRFIIFDEAAITDGMDAFSQSLRPTLDTENSKALFISTPRGKNNWFSVLYDRGFSDDYEQWASIKATWHENPRTSERDIDEAKKTLSDAYFRQEYLADFNVFEGQIWELTEDCIVLNSPKTEKMEIFSGLDLGFRDPTALVIIGYDRKTQEYWVLDEYLETSQSTEYHAKAIQKMIDKWNLEYIFIDSAAAQTRFDLAEQYGISTYNAKKSVGDGIGRVASLVENKKVKVLDHLTEVKYAFDQYQWNPNELLIQEKPLHNRASHMADAIRYAIYTYTESTGVF